METWTYSTKSFRSILLFLRAFIISQSKVTVCLLFLKPKDQQQLPIPDVSRDPFEVFLAEQGKGKWSCLKKQKVDDRRTSSRDDQHEDFAENVVELKNRLDEKNAECATLKGQLAELQHASKSQESVCKVSTSLLDFSTVKV